MSIWNLLLRAKRVLLRIMRYWRNFDWVEAIGGWREAGAFLRLQHCDKTVLMIEPNRYHAEVLPGYCHYFERLGFDVVLLLRRENARSGAFVRFTDDERPLWYAMHPRLMRRVLRKVPLKRFAFVYITSDYWAEPYGHFGLFCRFLGRCPEGKLGYAMAVHVFEHVLPDIDSGEVPISRISRLSRYQYKEMVIPMINPHYFGVVSDGPLGQERVFITVGTQFRSFCTLVDAVHDLERQGYGNFTVQVIGGEAVRENYPDAPDRIEFLGRLSFPEMYRRLEAADFYLFLLDPKDPEHSRYMDGTTTGSRQLIFGFLKVPVIDEEFASVYEFSPTNAIVHESDGLPVGMRRALLVGAEEYERLRTGLRNLRDEIAAESLSNLRNQIYLTADAHSADRLAKGGAGGSGWLSERQMICPSDRDAAGRESSVTFHRWPR